VLFSNLDSLTVDTPRVLVGLTWGNDDIIQDLINPPRISLADEEVKLADK
jgi:hypothetical protein